MLRKDILTKKASEVVNEVKKRIESLPGKAVYSDFVEVQTFNNFRLTYVMHDGQLKVTQIDHPNLEYVEAIQALVENWEDIVKFLNSTLLEANMANDKTWEEFNNFLKK